jgi:hypothetical protein
MRRILKILHLLIKDKKGKTLPSHPFIYIYVCVCVCVCVFYHKETWYSPISNKAVQSTIENS